MGLGGVNPPPRSPWRHLPALKRCWRRFCFAAGAKIQCGGKNSQKREKNNDKTTAKKRNSLHSSLKTGQTFISYYSIKEKEILWIVVEGIIACWFVLLDTLAKIQSKSRRKTTPAHAGAFLVVVEDVSSPELHSIPVWRRRGRKEQKGVRFYRRNKRLWEQSVTGHKEKQERKKGTTSPNREHPLVKNKEEKTFFKSFFFLINYSAASS